MLRKITVEDAIHHLLRAEEYDWLNYNDIEILQFICKLAEDSAKAQGILTMDFNEAVHYKQAYIGFVNPKEGVFPLGFVNPKEGVFPLGEK